MDTNGLIKQLATQLNPAQNDCAAAAVAVLVRPIYGDLEFFLVKRAEVDDDPWSGDMAFPGGKKSPADKNLKDTAMREVLEETSIDLRKQECLGYMEPVFSAVRRTLAVQPIVFRFDEHPKVQLNYELTRYLWAPLSELKNSKTHAVVKGWEGPVYKIQEETVWGLTFRMLENIIALLEY